MAKNPTWSREELITALDIYFKIKEGAIPVRNHGVKELSRLTGRNLAAADYKLGNLAFLDPSTTLTKASNGSKGDRAIWAEFSDNLTGLRIAAQEALQTIRQQGSVLPANPRPYEEVEKGSLMAAEPDEVYGKPPSKGNWTREEVIMALELYLQIPFGKQNKNTPEVITLAEKIGRTASSVAMKLGNLASLDPDITSTGRKGLSSASQLDKQVWQELMGNWSELPMEAERARELVTGVPTLKAYNLNEAQLPTEGKERERVVQARVNQSAFRKMVLANYQNACCITGLQVPALLVAAHIIPWKEDKAHRMNPHNGLALNALYDKAFESGLIAFDDELRLLISPVLKGQSDSAAIQQHFLPYEGQPLSTAEKFPPSLEFLKRHREGRFLGT